MYSTCTYVSMHTYRDTYHMYGSMHIVCLYMSGDTCIWYVSLCVCVYIYICIYMETHTSTSGARRSIRARHLRGIAHVIARAPPAVRADILVRELVVVRKDILKREHIDCRVLRI